MTQCGNFLEYAGSKCGIDVGFGKMILLYAAKAGKTAADLTATKINTDITSGAIIGVIKGWNVVAGASVAEVNVERTGTGEMKLIRPEILADTLTFGNSLVNNEVISDLVKMGTGYGILLDDQGNAFGDFSSVDGEIMPMDLNFSGKTTSSMQRDNTTEKTVAVTVRYLVKDLSVLEAGTETELIESKTLIVGQLIEVNLGLNGEINLSVKDKSTGEPFASTILDADVSIKGTDAVIDTISSGLGYLTIQFTGTLVAGDVYISISGDTFYMKETKFTLTA